MLFKSDVFVIKIEGVGRVGDDLYFIERKYED